MLAIATDVRQRGVADGAGGAAGGVGSVQELGVRALVSWSGKELLNLPELYHDNVEISIMKVGTCAIAIHEHFNALLTPEEAAAKVKAIWEKYVVPLQPGFEKLSAEYNKALKLEFKEQVDLRGNFIES